MIQATPAQVESAAQLAIDPNLTLRTGVVTPFGIRGIQAVQSGDLIRALSERTSLIARSASPKVIARAPGMAPAQAKGAARALGHFASAAQGLAASMRAYGSGDMLLGGDRFVSVPGLPCPSQGTLAGMVCTAAKILAAGRPVVTRFGGLTVVIPPPGGMPPGVDRIEVTATPSKGLSSPFEGGELGRVGRTRARAARGLRRERAGRLPRSARRRGRGARVRPATVPPTAPEAAKAAKVIDTTRTQAAPSPALLKTASGRALVKEHLKERFKAAAKAEAVRGKQTAPTPAGSPDAQGMWDRLPARFWGGTGWPSCPPGYVSVPSPRAKGPGQIDPGGFDCVKLPSPPPGWDPMQAWQPPAWNAKEKAYSSCALPGYEVRNGKCWPRPVACPPGQGDYGRTASGNPICVPCKPGYSPGPGGVGCTPLTPGLPPAGDVTTLPPGTLPPPGETPPGPCPQGWVQDVSGRCVPGAPAGTCPPGFYLGPQGCLPVTTPATPPAGPPGTSCPPGYQLAPDGRMCLPMPAGPEAPLPPPPSFPAGGGGGGMPAPMMPPESPYSMLPLEEEEEEFIDDEDEDEGGDGFEDEEEGFEEALLGSHATALGRHI